MVCCGIAQIVESEEEESISEEWVPGRKVAAEQSRHDRLVQKAQEKTLVIVNVERTRSRSLATTEPKQIPMPDLQVPQFQCDPLCAPRGQLQTLPADRIRRRVSKGFKDTHSVVPPDLQDI